jgi:hypothetical protein
MQLHAIVPAEHGVLDQKTPILVRRWKHHDIIDLPADVVVETLCLIGCDPVLVSLVADDDRIGVGSYDFLMNMADPLPIRLVFSGRRELYHRGKSELASDSSEDSWPPTNRLMAAGQERLENEIWVSPSSLPRGRATTSRPANSRRSVISRAPANYTYAWASPSLIGLDFHDRAR